MTPKVMVYTPATFGSTPQFWMPLLSNLYFTKSSEHAVIKAARFPSSASTAVAPVITNEGEASEPKAREGET